jgi:hypothetical protein
MNHDQPTILAAYDETVRKLYFALFDQYTQAAGDPGQEQQAEQHFTLGLTLARRARDRAVNLVD